MRKNVYFEQKKYKIMSILSKGVKEIDDAFLNKFISDKDAKFLDLKRAFKKRYSNLSYI